MSAATIDRGIGAQILNASNENLPASGEPFAAKALQFLRKWRWLIAGVAAAFALLGLVLTLLATPLYTATANLEIRRESFRITGTKDVDPDTQAFDSEFYQTQYGLLRTRALSEAVVRNLRLENDRNFFEGYGEKSIVEKMKMGGLQATSASARNERVRVAGQILLKHIVITPTRASRLVSVSFVSPDPVFSQRAANAWTKVFIDSTLERKFEATAYARRFLENRLEQLRQRLEESERLLVSYASQQGIINLPVPMAGGEGATVDKPIVAENLEVLNRELSTAIADRVKAQSRLANKGGSTAEALESASISTLRTRRAEISAEYSKMLTQFEPQYGPARALQAQTEQLDRAIALEEGRVTRSIRDNYTAALAREDALKEQVASLKTGLLDVRTRSIQYNIYQREVDTNRQLYDGLLV
jgi:polysaccharide biosynthesis transport protein